VVFLDGQIKLVMEDLDKCLIMSFSLWCTNEEREEIEDHIYNNPSGGGGGYGKGEGGTPLVMGNVNDR
jgi:hypothetical protein